MLLGNGDGTFQPAVDRNAVGGPLGIVVGDLNGDGRPDLAITTTAAGAGVMLGNGNATLQPTNNFFAGGDPRAIAVGDLNGDGRLDMVTANYDGSSTVGVLLNTSSCATVTPTSTNTPMATATNTPTSTNTSAPTNTNTNTPTASVRLWAAECSPVLSQCQILPRQAGFFTTLWLALAPHLRLSLASVMPLCAITMLTPSSTLTLSPPALRSTWQALALTTSSQRYILAQYNPANIAQNYLGDPDCQWCQRSYSVNVPPNSTFVVVVHEVTANAGCASYTLNV